MRLFGRDAECAALDAMVAGARHGRSSALVVRGEPGVGKTALLTYAMTQAPRAARIGGVESEATFPFAALHRLLVPLLPERDRLPPGQRAALEVACGLDEGPPADLYLVSLAALTLIAAVPGVYVVDDAQWLDQESLRSLAFVARRLHAEGVVLLFGWRSTAASPPVGVPLRDLSGLSPDAATALLAEVADGPLDPGLAAEIAHATGGNPLALTDLGRELTGEQLRGTSPLPSPVPIGGRLEAHYSAQVRDYPAATRAWLLVAAAGDGDPEAQVVAAAASLGAGVFDAAPAESDRLVTGAPPLTFRHPLMRSAVYGDATPVERRAAHAALAAATGRPEDADRRAWHLAAAAAGPDEATAAELERSADRAGARGGHAARATFLARAAELTADPGRKARRRTGAAEAALLAGAPLRALSMLDDVVPEMLDDRHRGTALLVRANAATTAGVLQANRHASAICLTAAEAFGDACPARAQSAILFAIEHEVAVEDLIMDTTAGEIAAAARKTAGDGPAAALLAAYASVTENGPVVAAPVLRRAVDAMTDLTLPDADLLRHVVVAVYVSTLAWDDRSRRLILERAEAAAHRTGALQALDLVHFMAVMSDTSLGRLTEADRHDIAGRRLRRAIGITAEREPVWRHPELTAWRIGPDGDESLRAMPSAFEALGLGSMRSLTSQSLAIHDIASGRYASARDRLLPLSSEGRYARVLPDLVECALRAGDRATATRAHAELSRAAGAASTDWAIGLLHRSGALLAGGDSLFRRAIERLDVTLARGDAARARLLYGEWLRRRRRRREAREQLGAALEIFEAERACAFAHRAGRELDALGGSVRNPVRENETALTPQEAAVARLARDGGTNAEIAAHLYLSASTVDYHLRKVYRKLGVRSRRELRESLHD
ncbi:AAA family ATPase [Actinoplanes solisilvae]|uniref:AAA family ATPase n=1 Tax=Actinoplanes solisilvae TaxID=2486853 RepID=UPI001F0C06BC|nr:LuxR family transcriptional regulator [Actinoplanes solisilvae]